MGIYDDLLKVNRDAPRSIDDLRRLARKLYVPVEKRSEGGFGLQIAGDNVHFEPSDAPEAESCGEYSRGLVDLTLASSAIEPSDRDEIETMISDAQPALERQKTIGHFRFSWTEESADTRDNVTEPDIDATAHELNLLYGRYATELRAPMAELVGGEPMIDVDVYFDAGLFGSTSSFRNSIFLNSLHVVRDGCRRKTTCAHELFHRVQYAYGYVTGTPAQRWWVEALGSWSQKYAYPDQHDYVGRVQAGLQNPIRSLLARSYDACHFWKFLGEQLVANNLFDAEFEAVRAFLEEHDANGKQARPACETILGPLHAARPFDTFCAEWAMANFAKDFNGASRGYLDNAVELQNCGRTYGPYPRVLPARDEVITDDGAAWNSPVQFVNQYGSDYFRFRLDEAVTSVGVRVEANPNGGNGEIALGLLRTKGDDWRGSTDATFVTGVHEETLDVTAEDIDGVVVVVTAASDDGSEYKVTINPPAKVLA